MCIALTKKHIYFDIMEGMDELFHIKKRGKKWDIIRNEDGVVVGTSDYKARALRSIGYRTEAVMKKAKAEKRHGTRKIIKIL